jgi:hypothetical protein
MDYRRLSTMDPPYAEEYTNEDMRCEGCPLPPVFLPAFPQMDVQPVRLRTRLA